MRFPNRYMHSITEMKSLILDTAEVAKYGREND